MNTTDIAAMRLIMEELHHDIISRDEAIKELTAERDRLRGLVQAVADAEKTAREYDRNPHLSFVRVEMERAAGACLEEAKRWEK